MKIVVLATTFPISLYIVQRVGELYPGSRAVLVTSPDAKPASLTRAVAAPIATLRKLNKQRIATKHRLSMAEQLWPSAGIPDFSEVIWRRPKEINTQETAELLAAMDPDVLLVSGAPILKPLIFSIPRIATVNVHYGIAPAYRGNDTVFWPLLRRDPDNIGLTLHRIDEGIDTGPILAQGWPALEPADDEPTIYARLGPLAVELIQSWMTHLQSGGNPGGRKQPGQGELFNRRDRHIRHEVRRGLDTKIGRYRLPRREQRIMTSF